MNAEQVACASSATVEHWDQIDWKRCERQVTRLQARIVKASREGRWGKVRCLQRLLTCSFSGKALAVKRVTENKGKSSRSGLSHSVFNFEIRHNGIVVHSLGRSPIHFCPESR